MRFSLLFRAIPLCAGLYLLCHAPLAYGQEEADAPEAATLSQNSLGKKPLAEPTAAAWAAIVPQYEAELARDPQNALTQLRAFIQANPQIKPKELISVYEDAATRLVGNSPDSLDVAITLLSEGRARVATEPDWPRITVLQAQLLLDGARAAQAETTIQAVWPQALQSKASNKWLRKLMPTYVAVLTAQGKGAEAEKALMETLAVSPDLLYSMGSYIGLKMMNLKEMQGDRAGQLSWAALNFRLWPLDADRLALGTRKLMQSWAQNDAKPNVARDFSAAQSDANALNPLLEVELPVWPAPVQKALAIAAQQGGANRRIGSLMALERYQEAMLLAREQLVKSPTSVPALKQVAMVFKAADGDVARSNAFITYYNSGQGENPMTAFLAEDQAKGQ